MIKRLLGIFVVALTLSLLAQGATAAGGDGDSTAPSNPAKPSAFKNGQQALEARHWNRAISEFKKVIAQNAKNVDALNYLGYAHRKKGDYDNAFGYYRQALSLNGNHKGANEYIGEAYLKTGNLEKAEFHLARLNTLCTFGCAEYVMLKRAVNKYKAGQ